MSPVGFDPVIHLLKFRMLFELDEGIGNLDQMGFQIRTGAGNVSGFDFAIALIIARAAASPGDKMFRRREHGHVRTNLGENGNGGHRVPAQPWQDIKQVQDSGKAFCDGEDFLLDFFPVGLKLVNVSKALAELDSLFGGDCPINGGLYFVNRGFVASVHKRSDIKGFAGVVEDEPGDGTGRLTKNVTEYIVKFQVGNSQAVLGAVFLAGEHIS